MKQLSIVLPCYNPPQHWEQNVWVAYQEIIKELSDPPEIIVVNDGSTQAVDAASIEFLRKKLPDFRYLTYEPNQGKGAALRHGVSQATGDWVIYTDIDFPYTTISFLNIWTLLVQGADVALGVKDAGYYHHVPKVRVYISRGLRFLIGFFFRMPVTDTQCGLKGFNQKGRTVFLATTIQRYLCDLEFVYQCFRTKPPLKIKSYEVALKDNIQFRKMNYRILFSEGLNFMKILLKRK